MQRASEASEHRPVNHGLRRGNRSVGVAHRGPRDHPALDDHFGLDAEKRRLPQHEVREFPGFHRTDIMRHAVCDCGIDGELRDVAAHAYIVATRFFSGQCPALAFHFVRRLPGARDDFADAAHGLRIRGHHADRAQIVKNIFGGNRLGADARFREGDVLRNRRAQVMAHHEHVQMLVERIDRERHRGIRGRRQAVRLAANFDDVRRVAAAGAFGVVRVNRASLERANRILHVACFVDRVRVNRNLHVEFFRDRKRAIDGRGSCAPVFVQLQANRAGLDLLAQRLGRRGISLAKKTQIDRGSRRRTPACGACSTRPACRWWRQCPWPGRCRRRSAWSGRPKARSQQAADK